MQRYGFCFATLLSQFLIAIPLSAAEPLTLRYSFVSNGRTAGGEVDVFHSDGTVTGDYEFNDRGRGPKISARFVLGANGWPARIDITGVDYLKAPVDEHFAAANNEAHWKSTSEHGDSAATGFYISNNGSAAETAFLVGALLRSKDAHVNLLPAGEAGLIRVAEATVESHGEKRHVTEYAVTGLAFTPETVWLDDEGHFFATPGKWFALMRSGWEDTNQQLYELQLKAEDARFASMARDLARRPAHAVAIRHVSVFDSEKATVREDQTVIIEGERIAAVGAAGSVAVPKDAEIIDGSGKMLLPGLFDMHSHSQDLNGPLNIASGVTSIRDMGSDIDELHHLQERWDQGSAIGPRVFKAGFIDGHSPFQAPVGLYADTVEEAVAAVNRYADLGYIQIKVYSSLKPELMPAIIKTAHERGLRVSGHIPNGMIASEFVAEGADEIQHINFIFLNFLAAQVKDSRTPERFTAVGANAAKLDLDSKPVADFIQLLKDHKTTVDVTLATFEGMFTGRPGVASPDFAPILSRLPAQVQREAYAGGLPASGANDQLYKDSYQAMLNMTKRLYDAGIPILAGTDALAGVMLHRELELEVRAGIPAPQALQIATFNAARLLKQEKELGSIVPGRRADLLLVEGNPARQISDIRRCRVVMKNGTIYESAALYRAMGMRPDE